MWKKWGELLLVVCAIAVVVGGVRLWRGAGLEDLLIQFAFIVVLLSIGILKITYPIFDQYVMKGFGYLFLGCIVVLALTGPMAVALAVSQWALEKLPLWAQYGFFVLMGILWCFALGLLVVREWARRIFQKLARLGWLAPLIFVFNYIIVSMIFFASISYLLYRYDQQWFKIASTAPAGITLDKFIDLFIWYLVDTIPVLKVTDTLPWEMPLDYGPSPSLLGWMVVLFKFAVIIPGIGAFARYWKLRGVAGTDPAPQSQIVSP